jgi:hypothetical protein
MQHVPRWAAGRDDDGRYCLEPDAGAWGAQVVADLNMTGGRSGKISSHLDWCTNALDGPVTATKEVRN